MKTFDLSVSRTIDATAEEVFDAWVDPSKLGNWFGAARVIMNPVVDGLYYLGVEFEGKSWPHYGRFLRIDRPRIIQQTWMSPSTRGLESVVTIAIEPRAGGVELTIRHTGLPDDEEGRKHEQGWSELADAFKKRFSEVKAQRAGKR